MAASITKNLSDNKEQALLEVSVEPWKGWNKLMNSQDLYNKLIRKEKN